MCVREYYSPRDPSVILFIGQRALYCGGRSRFSVLRSIVRHPSAVLGYWVTSIQLLCSGNFDIELISTIFFSGTVPYVRTPADASYAKQPLLSPVVV